MKTTCWSSNRASEWGRKGFKWLWTWNGCWCRRADLSISQTADLLGFSHTTISRVYRERSEKEKISSERQLCGRKCLVEVRGQRRMGRPVRDDRKTTVTKITTRYNQGMQNTISEHTTRRTLKQMGSSSRRPHRVPLLSAKNRKRRIQFTQDHQNWTTEIGKTLPRLLSLDFCYDIQMVGSELGVKKGTRVQHRSILPRLKGSGWCWWCNGVGDIFLAHFGPFSTNWASFEHHSLPEYCCWPCPSLYDHSVPSSDATSSMSQSSNHLRLVSWTWQWVHFTQMASTVTRSQSNRASLGCGGTRDPHHGCADDKSAATAWCYQVKMHQHLWGMLCMYVSIVNCIATKLHS